MSQTDPTHYVCHLCGYAPAEPVTTVATCPEDGSYLVPERQHLAHPRDPLLGRVIGGKYPVIGILGAGGMGAVYQAIQMPVGRRVALKVIRNLGDNSEEIQKRFEQEAAVVAGLTHPNTVTLYDFGVHEDGTLYMVLEMVTGQALTDAVLQGPLVLERGAAIVSGILDALVEAHGIGLVHRDLKPDNIMLTPTPWGTEGIKVLDFGIAKVLGGEEGAADQLTKTGVVFGTPRYMAPEQARGKDVDRRADIYAMGVILYECLSGDVPFDADNTFDILLAQIQADPPPIDPSKGVPEELQDVVAKALSKQPEDRYQDAREMAAAIREAAGISAEFSSASHDSLPSVPDLAIPVGMSMPGAASPAPPPPSVAPLAGQQLAPGTGPRGLVEGEGSAVVGGTSQELSAEMVADGLQQARRRAMRLPLIVGGVAAVVGAVVAIGLSSPDGADAPSAQDTQAAAAAQPQAPAPPPPPAPAPPSPRAKAEALDGEGIELWNAKKLDEALDKFRGATVADPKYAPSHYHVAAIQSTKGEVWPVIAALEAFLTIRPDAAALGRKLRADPDFSTINAQPDFVAWLDRRGIQAKPPEPEVAAQPPPKKKKRKKKRKKKAIEVPTF